MKRDINRFDMSDYAIDNAYDIPLVNKKGLMKDENNDAIMIEFGLRARKCMPCAMAKKILRTQKASRAML